MEEQGMADFLAAQDSLKVYMGISAGSMVAGHFVASERMNELFPEEDYGKEDGKPMRLLDLIFVPHMNSKWFKNVRPDFLEGFKSNFDRPTYATDDDTALAISGTRIDIVGPGASWIYKP
jgi:peptidase E